MITDSLQAAITEAKERLGSLERQRLGIERARRVRVKCRPAPVGHDQRQRDLLSMLDQTLTNIREVQGALGKLEALLSQT